MWNRSKNLLAFLSLATSASLAFSQVGRLSDQDVLQRGTTPTWADAQEQDVQFGAAPLSRDNLVSRGGWTQEESNKDFWSWLFGNNTTSSQPTANTTGTGNTGPWSDIWEGLGDLLYYTLWLALAIGILWSGVWLTKNQEFSMFLKRSRKNPRDTEDVLAQQAKYSDLPVELQKGLVGLRAQAAAYRDQGDYSRAIVYLFSYLLVELDQAQLISLAKGKTNYRYLRELNPHRLLQSRLRQVVALFEEAYFGRRTITKEQFDSVWMDLATFEASIQSAPHSPNPSLIGAPLLLVAVLGIPGLSGCKSKLSDAYGTSESQSAEASPGGLSVLREMVKAHDLPTETIVSLSPSMEKKFQTIVWTPNYFPFHTKATLDCFDRWLRNGGKTLVYVGRDYSPHTEYWDRIASNPNSGINATQRARGLIQGAIASTQLDTLRDVQRELLITPWFAWRQVPGPFRKVQGFQGEWADDPLLENCNIQVRSTLDPFDAVELDALRKELDWKSTALAPAAPPGNAVPARLPQGTTPPPPRKYNGFLRIPLVKGLKTYNRVWNTDDEEILSIAKGIAPGDFDEVRVLLAADDGAPLVTEVRYRSSTSKVLILSNSSIVSNLGLLDQGNRRLSDRLIDTFSSGRVGFLSTDEDPTIRQGTSQESHQGFEMLTVWPFNVMTIHAALLAMVAIIAAFPIFGRPKSTPRVSTANFGEHVESIGELLRATNGRDYAVEAISKYFRIVRRDQKSVWANQVSPGPQADVPSADATSADKSNPGQ